MNTKKATFPSYLIFSFGAILGAIVFIWLFGTAIIDPSNTSWIFAHPDDSTQHHLGWAFYRNTPWTFPICMTEGLTCNELVSCMYTDSIPIFAIIFKLLSPLLPDTFQYLGIWGVVCFALNGGFAALLLSRIKNNIIFTSLCSLFYTLFFPSINRITHHNSLGAIWLIMIAMILTIDHRRKYKHSFTPMILWSVVCVLATLIHIYFIPMLYFVMLGYGILLIFKDKQLKRAIITFASSTFSAILSLFVIGAFEGKSSYADGGYGIYSANVNTFFNSMGHSKYIRQLSTTQGQYEGYGYLGLGMLVCCFLGVIIALNKLDSKHDGLIKSAKAYIRKHKIELIASGAVFAVSFLWAMTTTVACNEKVIINIPIPHKLVMALGVFRATGRFIWLPCLIVMTTAIWLVTKLNKRSAAAALTICVWLQYMDMRNYRAELYEEYGHIHEVPQNVSAEEWEMLSDGVSELVFLPLVPEYHNYMQMYFELGNLAAQDKLKLSSFYLARSDHESIIKYADDQYKMLTSGNGRTDALYVFFNEETVPKKLKNFEMYKVGDYIFGRVKK